MHVGLEMGEIGILFKKKIPNLLSQGYSHDYFFSYFDKSLQFIVFENGKAGFNGEVWIKILFF